MNTTRREFVALAGAALVTTSTSHATQQATSEGVSMHGLIGSIETQPGQREALTAILLDGLRDMPGCLSYIVAHDPTEQDLLWITEVWIDKASHQASLSLPGVQAALTRGRPLIKGFRQRVEIQPVGGHGLDHAG